MVKTLDRTELSRRWVFQATELRSWPKKLFGERTNYTSDGNSTQEFWQDLTYDKDTLVFNGAAASSHPGVASAYAGYDASGFMNGLESTAAAFGPGGIGGFPYGQLGFGADIERVATADPVDMWANATFSMMGLANLDVLGLGWTGTNAFAGANFATMCSDPHLNLPNGGMADFRGKNNTYFNFLSSKNFALNVKADPASFKLKNLTVHGSFITEAHFSIRNEDDDFMNVSFWASELNEHQWGWKMVNGTCAGRPFIKGPHTTMSCGNIKIGIEHSSMVLISDEWEITVAGQPVYDSISGPKNRLDISYELRVDVDKLRVVPHGIVGQSFDGDSRPRFGRMDQYPSTSVPGEFTTAAMAEGAIEGKAEDYIVSSPFDTIFKYSRFVSGPRPSAGISGRPSASTVM